ncbi:MAG: PRC-barrel domain-containing protein, partial [Thermoplasmatota archaeon]
FIMVGYLLYKRVEMMKRLKKLEGKEVLTNDGTIMGEFVDFTYRDGMIEKMVVKMNKDVLEDIGEEKPMFSSVRRGISIENIKAISDNVVLYGDFDDLYIDFEEVSEEDLVSEIRNKKINGSEGRDVGKVEDILIDVEEWNTPSMLVNLNKEVLETLDLKGSMLSKTDMVISMDHVAEISDWIMLDKSADEMGDIIDKESVKKV